MVYYDDEKALKAFKNVFKAFFRFKHIKLQETNSDLNLSELEG